eukprot:TRINITY_DN10383_c0_g1_i1.p1 TRINITY_DN10383_c0_g1~~TRINITY_DN10383_c0_g1_i1.p1  ORF type:complete len:1342 (+),score=173.44 TRINITY_DN10383_c0_g1_i1:79-4104(+)
MNRADAHSVGVLLVAPGAHGENPIIISCSSGAASLLSVTRNEAIGFSLDAIFADPAAGAPVVRAAARGVPAECETVLHGIPRECGDMPGSSSVVNVFLATDGLCRRSVASVVVFVEADDSSQEGGEQATRREPGPARSVFTRAKEMLSTSDGTPSVWLLDMLEEGCFSEVPLHYRKLTERAGLPIRRSVAFCLCSPVPDYPILYASRSFTSLFGYQLSEVLGKNPRILQPTGPGERGQAITKAASALPMCRAFACTVANRTRRGDPIENLLTVQPLLRRGVPVVHVGWQLDLRSIAGSGDSLLPPAITNGGCIIESSVGAPVGVPIASQLPSPTLAFGGDSEAAAPCAPDDSDPVVTMAHDRVGSADEGVLPAPLDSSTTIARRSVQFSPVKDIESPPSAIDPSDDSDCSTGDPIIPRLRASGQSRPSLRGLQRQVLRTVELTELEVQQYERMFKTFDKDGSGTIDTDELRDVMKCLGVRVNDEELVELQQTVDTNRSGEIEFDEFLVLMKQYKESCRFRVLNKSEHTAQHIKNATRSQKILPDAKWKWCWDGCLLLAALYYMVLVLYQDAREIAMTAGRAVVEVCLTVVLLLDVVLQLNIARPHPRRATQLVESFTELAKLYVASWQFWVDLLSALPFDLVLIHLTGQERSFVRHFRLLKLLRIQSLFQILPRGTMPPLYVKFHFHYVPLIRAGFWWTAMVHALTCVRLHLAGERTTTNACGTMEEVPEEHYVTSLYWVLYTITSVGYGEVAVDTDGQKLFACFLFILGLVVNGIMIGKLTVSIQKGDVDTERMERMRETLAVIEHFDVPEVLQEEILAFQYHLLANSLSTSYSEVIVGLPQTLKDNLGLYMRIKFISSVGLFADAQEECKVALAQSLQNLLTAPEELVFVAGDPGEEMFFMAHGFADMISQSGRYLGTVKKGNNFGEEALLEDSPRSYSVKALTYCELFVLGNGDFVDILKRFPTFRSAVAAEMSKRNKEWRNERERGSTDGSDRRLTVMTAGQLGKSPSMETAEDSGLSRRVLSWTKDPPPEICHPSGSQQSLLHVAPLTTFASPKSDAESEPGDPLVNGSLLGKVSREPIGETASQGSSSESEGILGQTVPVSDRASHSADSEEPRSCKRQSRTRPGKPRRGRGLHDQRTVRKMVSLMVLTQKQCCAELKQMQTKQAAAGKAWVDKLSDRLDSLEEQLRGGSGSFRTIGAAPKERRASIATGTPSRRQSGGVPRPLVHSPSYRIKRTDEEAVSPPRFGLGGQERRGSRLMMHIGGDLGREGSHRKVQRIATVRALRPGVVADAPKAAPDSPRGAESTTSVSRPLPPRPVEESDALIARALLGAEQVT